jgi:hypothetical protein
MDLVRARLAPDDSAELTGSVCGQGFAGTGISAVSWHINVSHHIRHEYGWVPHVSGLQW